MALFSFLLLATLAKIQINNIIYIISDKRVTRQNKCMCMFNRNKGNKCERFVLFIKTTTWVCCLVALKYVKYFISDWIKFFKHAELHCFNHLDIYLYISNQIVFQLITFRPDVSDIMLRKQYLVESGRRLVLFLNIFFF